MKYTSTRDDKRSVSGSEAIISGLAPDGGLYVPESLPKVDWSVLPDSYRQLARYILGLFFPEFKNDNSSPSVAEDNISTPNQVATTEDLEQEGSFPQDSLSRIISGYDKFAVEEIVPIRVFPEYAFLELYHGPTSSFKDMALTLLPGLLRASYQITGRQETAFVMVATSGDTGSAALHGFAGQPGTEILVLYPHAGVSEIQQLQMESARAANAHVYSIAGNFDDAQRAIKEAFVSEWVQRLARERGKDLSSANSINIGRLAPQIVYYFYAYRRLVSAGRIEAGELLDISVPTGNFGDILAGIYAREMGLPLGNIICASNANKVLTDFFVTGIYKSKRDFAKTISPSMDILVSSNLERYLHLLSKGDSELIKNCYQSLATTGVFTWPLGFPSYMKAMCKTDLETAVLIRDAFVKHNYLIDPHTAVAYGAAALADNYCLILSTASPYKFVDSVLSALSEEVGGG